MENKRLKQTFGQAWFSLISTVQAAYNLAPFIVIVLSGVVLLVTMVAITSTKLMMGVVLLIVLGITIIVYATTNNFGEAALALVAGLLTAYSVTWTPSKFIAFIAVWSAFSFSAFLLTSLKLASQSEGLYRQAAIAICNHNSEVDGIEKKLQKISNDCPIDGLGPIQKAEVILLFSYRKLTIESQVGALKAVSILSVITQLDHKQIASFISDAYKAFDFETPVEQEKLVDILYESIKSSPVSPEEFIEAFQKSRRFVLSKELKPKAYLELLKSLLASGVAPGEIDQYIKEEQIV
ncbi:hypothetical protein [Desulfobacter postgatei]|jgi:hypothetical protein|uniref:hypothetical protein n=1 Tax=Desulfobacter postgatei TaxID=2293 RepID=UPI002A36AF67|nr:hypothetical protein [Desulfobacter postgatei]MDX9964096.1 hypothetical protein [Desulfobacter postgatei]